MTDFIHLRGVLAKDHVKTAEIEVPREVLPIDKQLALIADEWRAQWAEGKGHVGRHKFRFLINAPSPDGRVTFMGCEKCGEPAP